MGERITNIHFCAAGGGWTPYHGAGWPNADASLNGTSPDCYGEGAVHDLNSYAGFYQAVDLTNVSVLSLSVYLNMEGESDSGIKFEVFLDDDQIYECLPEVHGYITPEIDVSGHSGTHVIKLQITGRADYYVEFYAETASAIGSDLPPAPVAAFTGYPTSGAAPLEVAFTDASSNSPTEWLWDFGDGDLSTEQNPSHTYTDPGTYTVDLKATNAGGFGTLTKTDYIEVSAPPATGKMKWQLQIGPL